MKHSISKLKADRICATQFNLVKAHIWVKMGNLVIVLNQGIILSTKQKTHFVLNIRNEGLYIYV